MVDIEFTKPTSVKRYASSAVHSALLVGLDNANMIGRLLIRAISRMISSVNAPPTVEAPEISYSSISSNSSRRILLFCLSFKRIHNT